MEKLLPSKRACKYLEREVGFPVSWQLLYTWRTTGYMKRTLECKKFGGRYMFTTQQLDDWIDHLKNGYLRKIQEEQMCVANRSKLRVVSDDEGKDDG